MYARTLTVGAQSLHVSLTGSCVNQGAPVARRVMHKARASGFGVIASKPTTGSKVLFGSLIGLTFGLGSWQVNRYFWKGKVMEERAKLLSRDPVPLQILCERIKNALPDDVLDDLLYSVVEVDGVLELDKAVLVGPRAPPKHSTAYDDRSLSAEKSGYYIYAPLRCEDGYRLMVCRGWLPTSQLKSFPSQSLVETHLKQLGGDRLRLSGVVCHGEKEPNFAALPPDRKNRRYFWIDMADMAASVGMDAAEDPGAGLLYLNALEVSVLGGDNNKDNPLPALKPKAAHMDFYVTTWTHMGYALTWYSLSACTLAMTLLKLRR